MRSHKYSKTIALLISDPIIQEMAEELRPHLSSEINPESWAFIRSVLSEYFRRGGTVKTHIGGPAIALKVVMEEAAGR